MEKIIFPAGTKQSIETAFSDLQSYTETNLKNRLDRLISSYGIEVSVVNDVITGTALKVTDDDDTFDVAIGKAITRNFELINVTSTQTIDISEEADATYKVVIEAATSTDTPTALINGYLYNASGDTSTNTRSHETYEIKLLASTATLTTSQIYLADIVIVSGVIISNTDKRSENIFTIRSTALDDSAIAKNNQVGTFTENQGFGGKTSPAEAVDVTGSVRASTSVKTLKYTGDNSDVLIQPDNTAGKIILKLKDATSVTQFLDKDDNVIGYYNKDGFTFEMPVIANSGITVDQVYLQDYLDILGTTATDFKVGYGVLNGGAGLSVLTEAPAPTKPTNFRIYDIRPTENENEKKAYVDFRWNYDDIEGTAISTTEFRIDALSEGGTFNETSTDVIGKYLYFPSSGNKYLITGWNNSTKIMNLLDYSSMEEPSLPNYPARLIDSGTGYDLKFMYKKTTGLTGTKFAVNELLLLDNTSIYSPECSKKLTLGTTYWIQIKTNNGLTSSSSVVLPSGLYDPDHTPGGQPNTAYSYPLVTTLPFLEDDGAITLTASDFGYVIDVAGWYSAVDYDKTAHELEYGWTKEASFNWNANDIIKRITTNRHEEVSTPLTAKYQVGVRPYQNKQVVGLTKSAEISTGSGGHGVPDQLIAATACDVTTFSGIYTTRSTYVGAREDGYYISGITWYGDEPATEMLKSGTLVSFSTKSNSVPLANLSRIINCDYSALYFGPSYGTADIPAADTFSIGADENTRLVYKTTVDRDVKIKSVHINVLSATGVSPSNPAVLRVYQYGFSDAAGSIEIPGNYGVVTGDISVEIKAAIGTRTIVVDMFDPDNTSPNNTASVNGIISLYGENINYSNTNTNSSA